MRVIVPGGYYSYDSAGKKIWLDYQYYGTTLENIEKIKNLTRNKILYDYKRSTVLPTVENGCITHSYQGTEADTDKIQVTLKTPITNSLTELTPVDGVVTLETDGKVLVLPTANAAILPSFNQSVLDPNRLTIAESPFGGLKGSGSPDYAPGTLYTPTDGVYLTDVAGNNSTKTLTAGKLKELSLLTVDTTAHSITEEFIVENTATSNNPTVIDDCDTTTFVNRPLNCTVTADTTEKTEGSGSLKGVVTANGDAFIKLRYTSLLNIASSDFICVSVKGAEGRSLRLYLFTSSNEDYVMFSLTATGSWQRVIFPYRAASSTGTFNPASVYEIRLDMRSALAGETFYIDNITADTAKPAYIELQTPDNLTDSSLTLQVWDGSAYQTTGVYKLDSTYSAVSTTTENWKLADGTKFDDCYGSGNGRALFPKGASAETKAGSSGSITYSANKGTSKRIGFRVDLPPSDGGRTNFNKCRMKAILSYTDTVGNVVPDLSGNNNTGTIVGGVTKLNDGGLKLDGSTGYVNFGNPSHLQLVQYNDFSVAVRYKHVVGGQKGQLFDHYYFKSTTYSSTLQATFMAYNGTAWFTLLSVVDIYDGNEHFIIYNKSGNTINLYVDGMLRDSKTSDLPFVNGTLTQYLVFGRYNEGASVYTNGSLLSFSVLTRNPTASEITGNIKPSDTILTVHPTPQNMGSTTHDFADSTNASYGLQNLSKPWIALYDPANSLIDFYLFTHRPQNLSFKRDETGTIYSISLYPGAGSVYHGQIPFADLTLDTNSDTIPDCLEAAVNGSVTKFLANYSMVI